MVPPLWLRPPWNLSLAKTLYNCDSHISQQLHPARSQNEYSKGPTHPACLHLKWCKSHMLRFSRPVVLWGILETVIFHFLSNKAIWGGIFPFISPLCLFSLLCSCKKTKNFRQCIFENTISLSFKPLLLFENTICRKVGGMKWGSSFFLKGYFLLYFFTTLSPLHVTTLDESSAGSNLQGDLL